MTREEIRERAIIDLMAYKGFHRAPTEFIVDCVFKSIHPNVVIRVDRKLPKDKDCTKTRRAFDGTQERHAFDTAYFAAQQDMLKADYVAGKPLLEEK